jgi:hypothetical protein
MGLQMRQPDGAIYRLVGAGPAGDAGMLSDALTIWGMEGGLGSTLTDTFGLPPSFDSSGVQADARAGLVLPGWRNGSGSFVDAVGGQQWGCSRLRAGRP